VKQPTEAHRQLLNWELPDVALSLAVIFLPEFLRFHYAHVSHCVLGRAVVEVGHFPLLIAIVGHLLACNWLAAISLK
jgi:hypothetical protein